MNALYLPEVHVDARLKQAVDTLAAGYTSVEEAETAALSTRLVESLGGSTPWVDFCEVVTSTIRSRGYVVVRGLQVDDGRSLLILSAAFGAPFDTYGGGRIVKRFRMSPWTTELSHTIQAGDFHTDGNVSSAPPLGTAMQCEVEDPGAPEYAEQRVAFLPELLERLSQGTSEEVEAGRFLTEADAVLGHERSSQMWRGRLVQDGTIRYHPHSLRVACKRLQGPSVALDSTIAAIHRAAVDVSIPFHTRPGDTVLVSNQTALHYRGECSVRFTRFPTEFESRSLFVLHFKEPNT